MELHIPFRSQHRLPCASLLDTYSFSLPVIFGAKLDLHNPLPAHLGLNLSIEQAYSSMQQKLISIKEKLTQKPTEHTFEKTPGEIFESGCFSTPEKSGFMRVSIIIFEGNKPAKH
jgi:hypothetical protein